MARINDDPYYAYTEKILYAVMIFILIYYLPILITIFVLAPLVLKIYTKLSIGVCKSYRRIDGKTVIVTGANIGIGLETAKDLARRGGRIILACRNMERGREALDEIKRDTGSTAIFLKQLDLASFASVRKFCTEIISEETRLDILINNAGALLSKKSLTIDNLETNMQSNHFGPFLLTNLLLDLMRRTGKARIVNVASMAYTVAGTFDPDNLNAEKSFIPFPFYALTKLANIYFTRELDRRLMSAGIKDITVNSLHPGVVRTAFLNTSYETWYMRYINPITRPFFKTAYEGAQTTIHVAVSEEVEDISGEYFSDCEKASLYKQATDSRNEKILWERSVATVGLKSHETIVQL